MRKSEQSSDRNVFVYLFPVNANATSNEFPTLPLLVCGMGKPWEPFERRADLTAIRKTGMYTCVVKVNTCCGRSSIVRHSHIMPLNNTRLSSFKKSPLLSF